MKISLEGSAPQPEGLFFIGDYPGKGYFFGHAGQAWIMIFNIFSLSNRCPERSATRHATEATHAVEAGAAPS